MVLKELKNKVNFDYVLSYITVKTTSILINESQLNQLSGFRKK